MHLQINHEENKTMNKETTLTLDQGELTIAGMVMSKNALEIPTNDTD
jgi:hypothetical protein